MARTVRDEVVEVIRARQAASGQEPWPAEVVRVRFEAMMADLAAERRAVEAAERVGQLQELMVDLGVPGDLAGELTKVTVAAATITAAGVLPEGLPAQVVDPRAPFTVPTGPRESDAPTAQEASADPDESAAPAETRTSSGTETEVSSEDVDAVAVKARGAVLVDAVGVLTRAAGRLEGLVVDAGGHLTAGMGALLLAEKGAASQEELTSGQRDKWRARSKSLARLEVELMTGWGVSVVQDLVGFANTPAAVRVVARGAMARGEVSWPLVRRFLRSTSGAHLPHEDTAGIANALFGTDPQVAVTERLTSQGELTCEVWRHKEFYNALDREVAKAAATHTKDAATQHERAAASSSLSVMADEDGSAQVNLRCSVAQATAIADRVEGAARRARAGGDARTLSQLRADITAMLLLHGVVDLDGLDHRDGDLISPETSAQLARILHGLPSATLEVIVPLNFLRGPLPGAGAPCSCNDRAAKGDGAANGSGAGQECAHDQCHPTDPARHRHAGAPDGPDERPPDGRPPDGRPPDERDPGAGASGVGPPAGFFGVGQVKGRFPMFLSPHEVAALALDPASTMYRLVTDPLTGRCLERSTTAYRFDAAMRAQILAADVTCRTPGCLVAAGLSQIDHVQEFGTPGGETRESNGAIEHTVHHDHKTKGALQVTINENREMTWTTLLGKIYRTKAHDYTQYTSLVTGAIARVREVQDPLQRAGLIDAAIYQALSYRPQFGETLAGEDFPDPEGEFEGWDLVVLTHTDPTTGRRRYRPAPGVRDAEMTVHQDTHPAGRDEGNGDGEDGETETETAASGQDRSTTADPDADETKTAVPSPDPSTTAASGKEQASTSGDADDDNAENTGPADGTPWTMRDDEPPPF